MYRIYEYQLPDEPKPDIDDLIYGDAKTVPSER